MPKITLKRVLLAVLFIWLCWIVTAAIGTAVFMTWLGSQGGMDMKPR